MNKPDFSLRSYLWGVVFFLVLGSSLAFSQGRLRILLSNDDGYQDPGLKVLVTRLAALGEIVVSAPAVNQSGVGHGMTFREPIPVESWTDVGIQWYAVSAMPGTCVRLALDSFMDKPPDIVICGINRGENVGVVTFSSGTLAGAREAAFQGIPGISINLERGRIMDYDGAADFVFALVGDLRQKGLPALTFLNVNYPALPRDQVKGVLVTRLDTRAPDERYERTVSSQGKVSYRSIWAPLKNGSQDSDTWALSHGYISVTPLHIDQTLPSAIEGLRTWPSLRSLPGSTKKLAGSK